MRIHRLTLIGIAFIGLVTLFLSAAFYQIERLITLRAVADGLNQSLYYVENDLEHIFNSGRLADIQETLDQAVGVNKALANLSLSVDGTHIAFSSSRGLIGHMAVTDYSPLTDLYDGVLHANDARFRASIPYYLGQQKKQVWLLVGIDRDYVFGRLNLVAIFYGLGLFFALALMSAVVFEVVRRTIVMPLEQMAFRARTASMAPQSYFIEEFAELDKTLSQTFHSLHQQHSALKSAYENARYLDGILRTVADVNQLLVTSKTVDELMTQSVDRLAAHPGNAFCWIGLFRNHGIKLCACSQVDDSVAKLLDETLASLGSEDAHDPVHAALALRKTQVIDVLSEGETVWQQIGAQAGLGAFVVLPLVSSADEQPVGVLGLYTRVGAPINGKEIAMLEDLSGDIGFAIKAFQRRVLLQHHMTTDSDTGLPNRVALIDRLDAGTGGLLAIINIDRFSDINAVYGVAIGDALLTAYAHWLIRAIHGDSSFSLYKLGGDEFALLHRDMGQMASFRRFLDRLVAETARSSFTLIDIDVVITVSIGLAYASDLGLPHATAALKQAKMSHQSVRVFEGSSSTQEQENNIAWYKRIKLAIEESRVVPYFQPIIDNRTHQIIKYEALIRLIENDGTVVAPFAFLDVSKKTKLYAQLTRMMIDKVFDRLTRSAVTVSVNLSTEDLLNEVLAAYMEQRISQLQIGNRLIFEILESEGINNYETVRAYILRFKALGCQFAIDDFGAGYSNFDHLVKLNMDILKIDGSLIRNLPHDRNTQIIVKHICDFAHEMGISTVAEFVMNEAVYHWVRNIGIDASQGYFFHEPSAELREEASLMPRTASHPQN